MRRVDFNYLKVLLVFGTFIFLGLDLGAEQYALRSDAYQVKLNLMDTRISIRAKDAPVLEVLRDIGTQSDVFFAFDDQLAEQVAPLNLDVKNKKLQGVLEELSAIYGLKDTTIGTVTDLDGSYSITVPNEEAVLIFSFIGFVTQEEVVGNRSVINITLSTDLSSLDEVVVVGFGSQKKESIVGAMTSINPSELKIPSSNLTTSLAGRVAGLVSYQTSGEPGADNA